MKLIALFLLAFLAGAWTHGTSTGSAVLTIQSASLDVTGKILTLNIGSTFGGLSPQSGITNTTVSDGGLNYIPISVTASGPVVTVTLGTSLASGDTVTVSITTGGNLSDANRNTIAVSQTGKSVTNNSSVVARSIFANSTTGVIETGPITSTTCAGGVSCVQAGQDTEYAFQATGTDLAIFLLGSAIASVDGGAFATVAQSGAGFFAVPVFSGLADTAHQVIIKGFSGLGVASTFIVSGSSPAVSQNANYAPYQFVRNTAIPSWLGLLGAWGIDTVNGYNVLKHSYWDNNFSFQGNPTRIRIYGAYVGGSPVVYNLYKDGVLLTSHISISAPSGTTWAWADVATGLDGNTHVYKVEPANANSGIDLFAIMAIGGTIDTGYTPPAYSSAYAAAGDSITMNNANGTNPLVTAPFAYVSVAATAQSNDHINAGQGGSLLHNDVNSAYKCSVILRRPPHVVSVLIGVNDAQNGTPAATYQADYVTLLNNLLVNGVSGYGPLTNTTTLRVLLMVPFKTSAVSPTVHDAYATAIAAALASVSLPGGAPPVQVVNTDDVTQWPSDYSYPLHPGNTGNDSEAQAANALIPLIAATGYTDSGPSSGVHGSPSTNFTVMLATGATFVGNQTITISDGGASGTFTPSVGSPGTGSVTVTPTNGATSFTFTYTAASSGAKTLTTTNGQNWFDATPLVFTAS